MSKQESTNTFNDGMIKDMNPLTTPNTVLTDCINGTLITYNGNEFVLQNEMGNFKLEKARLTTNFIPVGIKEYGNIIYIVSYNPVTNECEVGSYPSPQRMFSTSDITTNPIEYTINPPTPTSTSTYNSLMSLCELFIYAVNDDFKLNPGDKFLLYNTNIAVEEYLTLDHYILDDNKKLTKIELDSKYIHKTKPSSISEEDFSDVKWNIPGLLCAKYRIANLDSFNVYLTSLTYPTITVDYPKKLSFGLNMQITTFDNLFQNPNLQEKLRCDFKVDPKLNPNISLNICNKLETAIKTAFSENQFAKKVNYGTSDLLMYFTVNIEDFEILESEDFDKLVITIWPKLALGENNINYSQFSTNLEINVKSLGTANDVEIASSYKYFVTENEVAINFTIDGPFTPDVSYNLDYSIYKFSTVDNGVSTKLETQEVFSKTIYNPNLHGQNITSIPLGELTTFSSLAREDIYIFRFSIKDLGINIDKFLITSSLMNSFYSSVVDFSTIKADEWLGKLSDSKYVTLAKKAENIIGNELPIDRTEGVFPISYVVKGDSTSTKTVKRIKGKSVDLTTTIPNEFKIGSGQGALWNNLKKTVQLQYKYNDIKASEELTDGEKYIWTKSFEASKYSQANINPKATSIPRGTKKYLFDAASGWNSSKTTADINIIAQGNRDGSSTNNFVQIWDVRKGTMIANTGNQGDGGDTIINWAMSSVDKTYNIENYLLFTFRLLGRGREFYYYYDDAYYSDDGYGCFVKIKSDTGWKYIIFPIDLKQPVYTGVGGQNPSEMIHKHITQIAEHIYTVTNVKLDKYTFLTPTFYTDSFTPSTFSFTEFALLCKINEIKYLQKYNLFNNDEIRQLLLDIKNLKNSDLTNKFNITNDSNLTLSKSISYIEVISQLNVPDSIVINLSDINMDDFLEIISKEYDKAINEQSIALETAQVENQVAHDLLERGYMQSSSANKTNVKDSYDKFINYIYYNGNTWVGKDNSLYLGQYKALDNGNVTRAGFNMYSLKNVNCPTLAMYDKELDNYKTYI